MCVTENLKRHLSVFDEILILRVDDDRRDEVTKQIGRKEQGESEAAQRVFYLNALTFWLQCLTNIQFYINIHLPGRLKCQRI